MHSFRLVPASEGPRREFKITLGLRAGYGSAERIYHLEEAIRTAHRWMRERAARGRRFSPALSPEEKCSTPILDAVAEPGNRQVLLKPRVTEIARHHNKTVPQVVFRFAIQLGMLPLTGTTDGAHMRHNLDIFDFTLTRGEIETMLALGGPPANG